MTDEKRIAEIRRDLNDGFQFTGKQIEWLLDLVGLLGKDAERIEWLEQRGRTLHSPNRAAESWCVNGYAEKRTVREAIDAAMGETPEATTLETASVKSLSHTPE